MVPASPINPYQRLDLELMEEAWPGSTVCLERDGVSEWMQEKSDVMMWLSHPNDGRLTIMNLGPSFTDEIRWYDWDAVSERWRSDP